jgi:hypothetical protein
LSHTETPNARKRGHEKHEDDTIRPRKRGRKPAVRSDTEKFDTGIRGLQEQFNSKLHDLKISNTKNQKLQSQISSLKKDLKEAQQIQQDLEESEELKSEEIKQLQNERSSLRRRLEKAIDDAKQDSSRYTKFSDSDITAGWGRLSFNVRDLVSQYLTKSPDNECDIIETLMKQLGICLPLSVCDITSLRVAVLRRTIWEKVILGVFAGRELTWHGKAGQMLTQIVTMRSKSFLFFLVCLIPVC